MDEQGFDKLVREASVPGSRRGVLRALAGAALAALGFRSGEAEIVAGHRRGHCAERCGGRCRRRCPDVMTRNRRTCECECPERMKRCGRVCVDQDRCCPGEKKCGGGCIREEDCCTHTHRECSDGTCLPKDGGACCPNERACSERVCIPKDACCPGLEESCPAEERGCCIAGIEACTDDGCCPLISGESDVCDGKCVDLDSDEHCGACGNKCGPCTTCRITAQGQYACVGPDESAPACETCLEGEVVTAVPCGNHCCALGAECCGNGCCKAGNCRVVNGQTCCLKVVDNRPYCQVM